MWWVKLKEGKDQPKMQMTIYDFHPNFTFIQRLMTAAIMLYMTKHNNNAGKAVTMDSRFS